MIPLYVRLGWVSGGAFIPLYGIPQPPALHNKLAGDLAAAISIYKKSSLAKLAVVLALSE
jgi:hypothetical protein